MALYEVTFVYYEPGEIETSEAYYTEVEATSELDAMRKVEAREYDIVAIEAKEVKESPRRRLREMR